jgi:hypothetical protein
MDLRTALGNGEEHSTYIIRLNGGNLGARCVRHRLYISRHFAVLTQDLLRSEGKVEFQPILMIVPNPDIRHLFPQVMVFVRGYGVYLVLGIVVQHAVELAVGNLHCIWERALHKVCEIGQLRCSSEDSSALCYFGFNGVDGPEVAVCEDDVSVLDGGDDARVRVEGAFHDLGAESCEF